VGVDDLFDGKRPPAEPPATPRLRVWLVAAAALVLLGPCCCTGPIGAVVAIVVWVRAGDEADRVTAGVVEPHIAQEARTIRNVAFSLMSLSALSLCLQAFFWSDLEPLLLGVASWLAQFVLPAAS
jgi:hypothetical protein